MLQYPDIGENSGGGNFGFIVKSLINKDCHNSRTSDDIDMKLVLLAKLDKRNTSCKETMTLLFFFSIYDQFGTIQRLDCRCIVHYSSVFMSNLLLKTELKKSLTQFSYYCIE